MNVQNVTDRKKFRKKKTDKGAFLRLVIASQDEREREPDVPVSCLVYPVGGLIRLRDF